VPTRRRPARRHDVSAVVADKALVAQAEVFVNGDFTVERRVDAEGVVGAGFRGALVDINLALLA
jgi:hypothetical protein